MERLGIVPSDRDGVRLAVKVLDVLRKTQKREIPFREWALSLGMILKSIYETQLKNELNKIMSEAVSLDDVLRGGEW